MTDFALSSGAKEAFRQSEQRFELMIASVRDYAIFMLDTEGKVATWNPGAERINGWRADEIIGEHFSKFYTQEDIDAGKPAWELKEAAKQGRVEDESWRVRKDGSRLWANVVISAVRDDEGNLLGFAKVTRDLTERRRVEQELAQRARQQAAAASLGIFALSTRDLGSVLERAVEVVAEVLDIALTQVLELCPEAGTFIVRAGRGWNAGDVGYTRFSASADSPARYTVTTGEPVVIADVEADKRFAATDRFRERGVVSGISVAIHTAETDARFGVLGVYSTRPRAFSDDDVYFVQTVANIVAASVARLRAEERVRAAEENAARQRAQRRRAEQAVRERDDFINVAAHELRTPLTALQLKLVGLARKTEDQPDKKIARRLRDAIRQGERLAELVDRLLDVSRMSRDALDLQLAEADMKDVVRAVVRSYTDQAAQSGTEICTTVFGDARGVWDERRLVQAIANLVSNAIKYGRGKPIDITVEGREKGVRITVVDRGIGIAATDVRRIFDRFERKAPTRHYGGLGLGLYITRHIVEAHGGTVGVASEPGKGATFVVDLPREVKAVEAQVEPEEKQPPSAPS